MYAVQGKIKGVAPLLFNRMVSSPEAASTGKKSAKDKLDEAQLKVYRNGNGLFLPNWTFKKVLMEGARKEGVKYGKTSLASFIEATVFVDGELLFGKKDPDFIHEYPGRIPPRTGAAVILRRPALETGWELPFKFNVMDDRIPEESLRRSLEGAGMLAGIGAWHPEYGRFVVVEWSKAKS